MKIKHIFVDLSYFMVQRGYIFKDLSYNGKSTGIYYGVLKLIETISKNYPESLIHICRDGIPIAKRRLYPAYKANRDEIKYKPSKDYSLIKFLQKMLVAYPNTYIWYEPEYEADDLIASLALRKPKDSIILSGDNDFLQLLCKGIKISKSIKNGKFELRTTEYISNKYKVAPEQLLVFRALQGDKSDNINGAIDTKRIRKIIDKPLNELLVELNSEEQRIFKRNLKLMSLKQFSKNPIHKKPLSITPDLDLFITFGLESLNPQGG